MSACLEGLGRKHSFVSRAGRSLEIIWHDLFMLQAKEVPLKKEKCLAQTHPGRSECDLPTPRKPPRGRAHRPLHEEGKSQRRRSDTIQYAFSELYHSGNSSIRNKTN